jgi:predicted phosphate transport protein (TIGR00153 family)
MIKHSEAVLETVKALHEYISVIRKKKPEKRLQDAEEQLAERVLELEDEADKIEKQLDEELYKGAFLPVTSSDRYDLVASIDGIADRCEIVVRKMRIVDEPIPLDIKEKLIEMAEICVEATTLIVESIRLMSKEFDASIENAKHVYPLREKNRDIEFLSLQLLFKHELKSSSTILLNDIIQLLGRTGDRAKQSADAIISMVIKYRS